MMLVLLVICLFCVEGWLVLLGAPAVLSVYFVSCAVWVCLICIFCFLCCVGVSYLYILFPVLCGCGCQCESLGVSGAEGVDAHGESSPWSPGPAGSGLCHSRGQAEAPVWS